MLFAKKVVQETVKASITNKKVVGVAVVGFVAYQIFDYWKTKKATENGAIAAHNRIQKFEKEGIKK